MHTVHKSKTQTIPLPSDRLRSTPVQNTPPPSADAHRSLPADDVVVRFRGRQAFLQNVPLSTVPLVVVGAGAAPHHLGTLGNYLAGAWDPREGCRTCWDAQKQLGAKVGGDGCGYLTDT